LQQYTNSLYITFKSTLRLRPAVLLIFLGLYHLHGLSSNYLTKSESFANKLVPATSGIAELFLGENHAPSHTQAHPFPPTLVTFGQYISKPT
ncbi:hypothetical protein DXG01_014747, partial [Tephrocybe rancida]